MSDITEHPHAETLRGLAREMARDQIATVLGVNLDDADSARAFREDLAHARRQRIACEAAAMWTLRVVITTVVGGLITLMWLGFEGKER